MKKNKKTFEPDWPAVVASGSNALITVVGLIAGVYLSTIASPLYLVLGTAIFVTAIFCNFYLQLYFRSKGERAEIQGERAEIQVERAEIQVDILEKEKGLQNLTDSLHNRADLLLKALGCLTDVSGEVHKIYKRVFSGVDDDKTLPEDVQQCKRSVLKNLSNLLSRDQRNYTGEMDYFKATLFRVETRDRMIRDSWWYPGTQKPRTHVIDATRISDGRKVTAFRCLDDQNLIAIPNVPKEVKKPDPRWIPLYTGQEELYGSMLSVPIYLGEPGTDKQTVIAILTIDTNRLDYFLDTKEYINLWANLLGPYWSHLNLLYEIEEHLNKRN